MVLLFKTKKGLTSGQTKGLKIDTAKKEFSNGYFTLSISEIANAIEIKNADFKQLVEQAKQNGYKEI